jgi:RNA polymerase sigma-70 factor (ECF subfamily)
MEPSDASLVAAVVAGEVGAFATLLGRYRDLYTRFAIRVLGNYEDAEDALQSAFMRAYRGIRGCQDPDRFGGWLYRIVVNECRTVGRMREQRERRFVREPVDHLPTPAATDGDALREEIQQALNQLPVEHREAFVLKYVEDMSYEEMSALTGAGVSALKMRVKRSCDRLRELLTGIVV